MALCHGGGVLVRAIAPGSDSDLASDLLSLQRIAYACEAALIGDDRIPPQHEGLEELVGASLTCVGAFTEGQLVGALAYRDAIDHLDIDRLVVSPHAHRRGAGSTLVREALHRAGPRHVLVATGRDNHPARVLYERLDFSHRRDEKVLPGLWIARYEHLPR